MKLNRHNYEEYFILYMDNELGSDDRREVELFAAENPDLKAELDMLLQSKLIPDTDITFTNKASLLVRDSSSISMNNYEEWLLSYVDNELAPQELKHVEKFIAEHPEAKIALGLLQKTKLQPEAIVFPYKESLYRKEEKAKVVAIYWRRWAVAAALLIGISTTFFVLLNNKPGKTKIETAKAGQSKIETPTGNNQAKQPGTITPETQENIADNTPQKSETTAQQPENTIAVKKDNTVSKDKNDRLVLQKQDEPVIAKADIEDKPSNNLPRPDNNPNVFVDGADLASGNDNVTGKPTAKSILTNTDTKPDATSVTSEPSDTYHNSEKAANNTDAVFASNDGKKNKLRGFFRKITRTFEKRTNIKATDDEDRLLIAGLAIKLN